MPTRRSVPVVKALRSWIELAIAHPTTSADSADDVVVSVQVQKSGDILPFGVQALAAEDVLDLEWLQPSLVDDLKAAAALLSSVVVEAGCQRLQAIVIDVPCMYHACPH